MTFFSHFILLGCFVLVHVIILEDDEMRGSRVGKDEKILEKNMSYWDKWWRAVCKGNRIRGTEGKGVKVSFFFFCYLFFIFFISILKSIVLNCAKRQNWYSSQSDDCSSIPQTYSFFIFHHFIVLLFCFFFFIVFYFSFYLLYCLKSHQKNCGS